jgi:hypothetical protein
LYGFFTSSTALSIRSGDGTNSTVVVALVIGDTVRIEKDSGGGVFRYKVNGVEVGTQPIGAHSADFQFDQLAKFSSSSYGSPVFTYINANNQHIYLFNEREGLTVTDQIGTNNGTLTSDIAPLVVENSIYSPVQTDGARVRTDTWDDMSGDFFKGTYMRVRYMHDNSVGLVNDVIGISDFGGYHLNTNGGILRLYVNWNDPNQSTDEYGTTFEYSIDTAIVDGSLIEVEVWVSADGSTVTVRYKGVETDYTAPSLGYIPMSYFQASSLNRPYGLSSRTGAAVQFQMGYQMLDFSFNINGTLEHWYLNEQTGTQAIGTEGTIMLLTRDVGSVEDLWVSNQDAVDYNAALLPQWVKSTDGGNTWVADDGDLLPGNSDAEWLNRQEASQLLRNILGDSSLKSNSFELDKLQASLINEYGTTDSIPETETGKTFFFGIETNGAGTMALYVGTTTTECIVVGVFQVGIPAIGTQTILYGNATKGGRYSWNGYFASPIAYNRQIGLEGFELLRQATLNPSM